MLGEAFILVVGIVILALIWSDRGKVAKAWRTPSRWWKPPPEGFDAKAPSQPGNLIIGCVLGLAAVIYSLIVLLR